ncbi:oxalate:formate antiporter [Vibrio sp. Isolate33]|uniref:oxalate:formate antiporter n=1 Tax=Vibrio sp. Isolate33 TaxID=2908539 RepID=UPI001EFEB35C|nr:oxalate:formate antiporter [Vibrio sp. Isolate33]MCG9543698.1 oxalate:formate antiporter [Vibrio sp. Isolate33]
MNYPSTLPAPHKTLLIKVIDVLSRDPRICGIAASGSFGSDSMDKYSDLDFVIAINPADYESVMQERFDILDNIGGKVAAFTGEHVGEPRLIVSIFGPEPVHVDFKFVSLPDAAVRVDNNHVLWERDSLLTDVFSTAEPHYPQPDPQWIEDRFWIWTHYAATKIARGEYFETVEFLSFLRQNVLSPLALKQAGLTPSGVRKIEERLPEFTQALVKTVAMPERDALIPALKQAVTLYLELRGNEQVNIDDHAQSFCLQYVEDELS